MDRLAAYATREAEEKTPEERQAAEEEATTKLLEKLKIAKDAPTAPAADEKSGDEATNGDDVHDEEEATATEETEKPVEEVNGTQPNGIPDNIKLFEIFHEQVMNLVNAQRLPIQDTMALLGSLANLALYGSSTFWSSSQLTSQ